MTGRFDLGAGITGATVQVRSLDGSVLAQTVTNRSGHFLVSGVELPSDFRVAATLGTVVFSREVRGYTGSGQVIINVPTSLVSQAVQSAGLSAQEAEARVRAFLRYPADFSLDFPGTESGSSPFSHLAFFSEAAKRGGWQAFRDVVVGRLRTSAQSTSSGVGADFQFSPGLLKASYTGLEPELLGPVGGVVLVATYTANDGTTGTDASPNQYMGLVLEGLSDQVLAELFPDDSDVVSSQAVRAQALVSLLEGVGDLAKDQLIDIGWTHIADALNLNYGTTRMLEVIQEQLDQVLSDLAHLEGQLDMLAIEDTVNTLSGAVARTQSQITSLKDEDPTAIDDPNTPYTPSDTVDTMLSNLASNQAGDDLTQIQNALSKDFFQNSVMTYLYNQELGINDISGYGNAPFLSAGIQSRSLTPFNYYGQVQQSACNIISENAHALAPNPYSDMNQATTIAEDAAEQLKLQRGFVPQQLLSNYIIVDFQSGLMWYTGVFDESTWSDAVKYSLNCGLTVGNGITYQDWRLPTEQDFEALQDRARCVAINRRDTDAGNDGSGGGYADYGYSVQGLVALGFDKASVDSLIDKDGTLLAEPATMEDGRWATNYNVFRLNHESGLKVISSTEKHPFILCRSIGTTPVNFPDFKTDSNGNLPFRVSAILPQEYPMLGYATNITNVQAVNGVMGATVNYTIKVGGSFTMGTNNEDSRDYQEKTYTQNVDTFHGGSNDYAGPYDLLAMISFQSQSQTLLTVGATGKLLWHVDSVAQHTVNVQATMNSTSGAQLTATGSVTATPPARQIKNIQIWPRNRYYTVIGTTAQESYYCMAFYDDNTIADVTSQVTWSINSPNAGVTFSTQQSNLLKLDGTLNPAQFVNISASLNGTSFKDTTGIEVISQ